MALGQVIVKQLELEDRGAVVDRWLAHHLAEVIAEADRATGTAKAASEAQAVDLILKLWIHRRALPEPVDPLGGCRKAIEVLGRLSPEADPWSRFRQPEGHDGLLHEMFRTLCRIVILRPGANPSFPNTSDHCRGVQGTGRRGSVPAIHAQTMDSILLSTTARA